MNEERKIPVEEVDSVEAPRKARVDDDTSTARETMERKRDYLDGFLKQAPVETSSGEPGGDIYEGVINALKEIYDPEIPVNIYDLGLIYGVDVTDDGHVEVTMTLTTPHCPVAESMRGHFELLFVPVPGWGMWKVNMFRST